ncbi:unnamed protein product [Echinostoma caproni]|uniref:Uncharacterized protein n=1 Tax=Echinostoma caproni TaxID=27848 RepID=A0A3P8G8N4_9TREM|nr:unnamed protein product [Echinostoma caproni]
MFAELAAIGMRQTTVSSNAYDGPQSYELTNPDELCSSSEVQVIRVNALHEQGDTGQTTSTTIESKPTPIQAPVNLTKTIRKPYSVQSFQDADEAAITRSSTLLSSLDQDALLLSASDEEDPRPNQNGVPADLTVASNQVLAPAVPARLPFNGDSTLFVPTENQSLLASENQSQPQLVSRFVDWTRDSTIPPTTSPSQLTNQSPIHSETNVLDVSV